MNLVVVLDHRFQTTPDGKVWSFAYGPSFWNRYLSVFSSVQVLTRVQPVNCQTPGYKRSDCQGVRFTAVPYYRGPAQYIKKLQAIRKTLADAIQPSDAVILRTGQLASIVGPMMLRRRQPYAVEVIGDPYEQFAKGNIRHPLRHVFQNTWTKSLKRQCLHAVAVSYVTNESLQRRYPCPRYSVGVSDVEIDDCWLEQPHRTYTAGRSGWRVISVGTMDQRFKGYDTLISAIACCTRIGLKLELILVGDGVLRDSLQRHVQDLELSHQVSFIGTLPSGQAVRDELDKADLFVLASRTEGLPRTVVEAMARGLPCIATRVGGIPELLPPDDLVPPGDHLALAAKITEVLSDQDRLESMSIRNHDFAKGYRTDVLLDRRMAFYHYLADTMA